ncbi:phosphotransferase family protein [Streptomyces sp. TS71-3]|uniref:phosphotransferase family protein n=1 Tax=Streptomyces sp. TS71-3 TaxID=2733862 RepID=UPI001AFDCE5E|nr:aminoglycoside phosphotransferase family protein [Streptomyces sp. TS71-3]GHJ36669.1 phosphotransferase [Streptomyces sp. TS71-3]
MEFTKDPDRPGLGAALTAVGVPLDEVADCRELGGGTYNTVFRVRRTDGTGLVVKLAPDPATPVLGYERGILGTEALYYERVGGLPGVRVPHVRVGEPGAGGAVGAGGFLVMSECPGTSWYELGDGLGAGERRALRAELGRQLAAVHTLAGEGFGYPAEPFGPLRSGWRVAFLEMVGGVLADAVRFGVPLPRPAEEIHELFAAQGPVLDEVTVPRLVHFDLWDGNILVDRGTAGGSSGPREGATSGQPRIGALIDAERAFWGDPLAEFVSLALFGDIEDDPAFLAGYRAAGGTVTFDTAARRRLELYRCYLHLIMWTEAVPRGYGEERRAWLRERVLGPLAATLDTWRTR